MLSPLLFNLYINDLPSYISDTHGGVRLGEMTITCLLYADDLVILAENEVAMQALLKKVCDWCSLWEINVNSNIICCDPFSPSQQLISHVQHCQQVSNGTVGIPNCPNVLGTCLTNVHPIPLYHHERSDGHTGGIPTMSIPFHPTVLWEAMDTLGNPINVHSIPSHGTVG